MLQQLFIRSLFLRLLGFFLFLGCAGSSLLRGLSCNCCEQGLLSRCSAWATHWGGFSCCRAWALEHRLSSCGSHALLPWGTWDLPGPRIEMASPALADGFFTAGPTGKPWLLSLIFMYLFGRARSWLWHTGSSVVACKLSCSMWDLVPQPVIRPGPPPCTGSMES